MGSQNTSQRLLLPPSYSFWLPSFLVKLSLHTQLHLQIFLSHHHPQPPSHLHHLLSNQASPIFFFFFFFFFFLKSWCQMESKTKAGASRFSRYIKAISPFRVLSKARDFYVRSLTDCAGRMNYGVVMGGPGAAPVTLPKSFSTNSSRRSDDEDLCELVRAASQRRLGLEKIETPPRLSASRGVPRSRTVAIGRIDEDQPCNFQDDLKANSNLLFPRSKSYAVTKKRTAVYS